MQIAPANEANQAKATIHVLIRKEWHLDETGAIRESWLAQGIEKDISAVGATLDDALLSFQRIYCGYLILGQDLRRNILEEMKEAPESLHVEFRRASPPDARPYKIDFKWDAEICEHFDALPNIVLAVA